MTDARTSSLPAGLALGRSLRGPSPWRSAWSSIGFVYGTDFAAQFFAGYVTEYSLSVDNPFVFMVIMSSFAVPKAFQHRVLLVESRSRWC